MGEFFSYMMHNHPNVVLFIGTIIMLSPFIIAVIMIMRWIEWLCGKR